MIGLVSRRRLGSRLLRPGQTHRSQLAKLVIREYDGPDTPAWHASDPIERGLSLDLTTEVKLTLCDAPALPTSSQSYGSGLSECDTSTITESDLETSSYWRHVSLSGSSSRLSSRQRAMSGQFPLIRTEILGRGLQDIQGWLDNVDEGFSRCIVDDGQEGTSSAIDAQASPRVAAQPNPSKSASKRLHESPRSENDGNESNSSGDIRHPKRHQRLVETNSRFACPFFKRNPHRYMGNRTCAGPGWTTTHRVKEHIYRRHMLPRYPCPRCHTSLASNQQLNAHLTSTSLCHVYEGEPLEGVSAETERQLRKRNRFTTEEEKWLHMYQLLFPGDDVAANPTPYYEYVDEGAVDVRNVLYDKQIDLILEYEDFLCEELPQALQVQLQHEVEEQLGIQDPEAKKRAVDVIQNGQLRLLYSFLNRREKQEDIAEETAASPMATPSTVLAFLEGSDPPILTDILSLDFSMDIGDQEFRWFDTTWISSGQADQQQEGGTTISNAQEVGPLPPSCEGPSASRDGVMQEYIQVPAENPQLPDSTPQDHQRQRHSTASALLQQRRREREMENQKRIEKLEADNRELRERLQKLTGESNLMDQYPPLDAGSQTLDRLVSLQRLEIPPTNSRPMSSSPWPVANMAEPYSFPSPPVLVSFPDSPSPYQPASPYRLPNSNTPPSPLHSTQIGVLPVSQGMRGSPGYESGHSSPGSISSSFAGQRAVDLRLQCPFRGCTAGPFSTAYLLKSHSLVHSEERKYFCEVKDCPRGEAGMGFKRMNELNRHSEVHSSALYYCPFCPGRDHWFPRPDNLRRHVRIQHTDKEKDDPVLREALAKRRAVFAGTRGHN